MNNKNEITVKYEIDGNEIALSPSIIKNFLLGDTSTQITLSEFKYFVEMCKMRKLNPFLKEIFLIKYGNQPAAIVVSKDVILRRALANPNFNGIENGIIVKSLNGEIIERKGGFKLPNETLVGAWAKVYRKDVSYPYYVSLPIEEMEQRKKDGTLNTFWANKATTMAIKVVTSKAIRETFIEDFSGLYDESEVDNMPEYKESENNTVIVESEKEEETKTISMDEI